MSSYDNALWLSVKDILAVNIVVINFLCNLYHISDYVFMELYLKNIVCYKILSVTPKKELYLFICLFKEIGVESN